MKDGVDIREVEDLIYQKRHLKYFDNFNGANLFDLKLV
jgi:hypothetical protein